MAVAVAVAVAVSGGGAVVVAVPVAGLTKRFFLSHPKRFLNQCLRLLVLSFLFSYLKFRRKIFRPSLKKARLQITGPLHFRTLPKN